MYNTPIVIEFIITKNEANRLIRLFEDITSSEKKQQLSLQRFLKEQDDVTTGQLEKNLEETSSFPN